MKGNILHTRLSLNSVPAFISVACSAVCILNFNLFGTLGLVLYGLIIAYGCFVLLSNYKKISFIRLRQFYCGIAFFLVMLLTGLINGSFKQNGPTLATFLLITLAGFVKTDNEEIKSSLVRLAKIYTIMGFLMATLSLGVSVFNYIFPGLISAMPSLFSDMLKKVGSGFPQRMTGFGFNPNTTAVYVYVAASLSIYLLYAESKKFGWTTIAILNVILAILTIFILTNSRTSMLAFSAFAALYVTLSIRRTYPPQKTRKISLLILLLCIMLLVAMLIALSCSEQLRDYVFNDILRIKSLSNGSGRLQVYSESIKLAMNHPITGAGYDELLSSTSLHVRQAHNQLLDIFVKGGILSLILYVFYFFSTVWNSAKVSFGKMLEDVNQRRIGIFFFCFIISQFIWGMTEACLHVTRADSMVFVLLLAWTNVFWANISNGRQPN